MDLSQNNAHELQSVRKDMDDALEKASTDQQSRMRQLQDQVDTIERQIGWFPRKFTMSYIFF